MTGHGGVYVHKQTGAIMIVYVDDVLLLAAKKAAQAEAKAKAQVRCVSNGLHVLRRIVTNDMFPPRFFVGFADFSYCRLPLRPRLRPPLRRRLRGPPPRKLQTRRRLMHWKVSIDLTPDF